METLFAKIIDGIVVDVHVVSMAFIKENPERYGDASLWHETFSNTEGKTYGHIGYEYLSDTKNFRPQQPFASWTWANKKWNPPTPMPSEGRWSWNEAELKWSEV